MMAVVLNVQITSAIGEEVKDSSKLLETMVTLLAHGEAQV